MIKIKKGLDLPITGNPDQSTIVTKEVSTVAPLGIDYVGMRPTMEVRVADDVKLGQVLFTDKKYPQVKFTSPGAGKILSIHRGHRRVLLSVVIKLSGNDEITFNSYTDSQIKDLDRETIVEQLLNSGAWVSLRTRPFSRFPDPESIPHSIFITAIDTNPLAPSIQKIIEGNEKDVNTGLVVLSKLTDGKLFYCKDNSAFLPNTNLSSLVVEEFSGPHPAGNVGTHIHFLDPVNRNNTVWHIGIQDVIAIGKLFTTGRIYTKRIVSLAGPTVNNPKLISTRLGASVKELIENELVTTEENRVISGSVLSGFETTEHLEYLGRFHQQISVVREERERKFLGWLSPGLNRFSVTNISLAKFFPNKKFNFGTSTHGEERAILPNNSYEKVMPMDILPLFLMRALAINDVEDAESLGCLELDEEDLSLCAFICPSKLEFGPMLRRNLTTIEKEG